MATGSRLASRLIGTRIITGGEQTMNSLTLLTPAHTRRRGPTLSPTRGERTKKKASDAVSEGHAGRKSSTSWELQSPVFSRSRQEKVA